MPRDSTRLQLREQDRSQRYVFQIVCPDCDRTVELHPRSPRACPQCGNTTWLPKSVISFAEALRLRREREEREALCDSVEQ